MQSKSIAIGVLVLAGLYFLIVHTAPLPLNHEEIGLGTNHVAHSIFGIVLLVGAGFIQRKNKNTKNQD